MSSWVLMKVLESAPHRYDRGMRWLSGGRMPALYERVAAQAGAAPGVRVLDVGCGTGGVARACAARGAHVVGIDTNAEMLEVARAAPVPDAGRVEWIQLGAAEIEDRFGEAALDAAVSCLAFSELSDDERRYALAVLRTRLRPGGALVIADEVWATTAAARVWQRARRLPVAALTWVLTQTTTRAVAGLADAVGAAGFVDVVEHAEAGDLAIVTARAPGDHAG